jgi:hypothetical protein
VPDGSVFCVHCGKKIEKMPPADLIASFPDITEIDPAEQEPEPEPRQEAEPKQEPEPEPEPEEDIISYYTPAGAQVNELAQTDEPPEEAEKPAKKPAKNLAPGTGTKPSFAKSFFKAIISVFLSLLLFTFVTVFTLFLSLRPEKIPEIIAQADIAALFEQLGLSERAAQEANLSLQLGKEIDEGDIGDLLERSAVQEEIAAAVGEYILAAAEGDYGYYPSNRDVVNFLEEVASDIRSEIDYELSDYDYEVIKALLVEYDTLSLFSIENLLTDNGVDFALPYVLLSFNVLLIAAVLCFLVVANIFLLHRNRVRNAFLNAGIPLLLCGILFVMLSFVLEIVSGVFAGNVSLVISCLSASLASALFLPGLVCGAVGIAFLLVFAIISIVKKLLKSQRQSEIKNRAAWRLVGLAVNLVGLVVCGVLFFVCLQNAPLSDASLVFASKDSEDTEQGAEIADSENLPEYLSIADSEYEPEVYGQADFAGANETRSSGSAQPAVPVAEAGLPPVPKDGVQSAAAAPIFVSLKSESSVLEARIDSNGAVATYYSSHAFDNNPNTAWCEDAYGAGVGEWVQADFAEEVIIKELYIKNGNWASPELLQNNGRVKTLRVSFPDGSFEEFELTDPAAQNYEIMTLSNGEVLTFESERKTTSAKLEIMSTYDGSSQYETYITDIVFYGYGGASQPVYINPPLATVYPQPEASTPQPEASTPQPQALASQPGASTPQPGALASQAQVSAPQPAADNSQLEPQVVVALPSELQQNSSSQSADNDYILAHSSIRQLTDGDLLGLTKEELRIARNEIYARYGRQFVDENLRNYFNSKAWYTSLPKLPSGAEPALSKLEQSNIELIKEFEAR